MYPLADDDDDITLILVMIVIYFAPLAGLEPTSDVDVVLPTGL